MDRIPGPAELRAWRDTLIAGSHPQSPCISVCGGTGCRVYGSEKVWDAFREELAHYNVAGRLEMEVKATGCHGFCEKGPLVVIRPQGIMYAHVKVEDVPRSCPRR